MVKQCLFIFLIIEYFLRPPPTPLFKRCWICSCQYCPTLTKGSKWQITQIWESDVFRLDLACSTSIPSFEQKLSSCWEIFMSRHHDIALTSMYMTDTFCSFTRNVIFQSCFLLSKYRIAMYCIHVHYVMMFLKDTNNVMNVVGGVKHSSHNTTTSICYVCTFGTFSKSNI